jgi:hypothetical protein
MYFSKKNPVLTTVDGTRIRQSDVNKLAEERLAFDIPQNQREEIEKNLLNDLVIQKIIENEAKKRGIAVTEEEIDSKVASYAVENEATRNLAYNEILKEKVKSAVVSWKIINYLFVYKEPILENYNELANRVKLSMESVRINYSASGVLKTAYNQAYNSPDFDRLITLTEGAKVYYDTFDENISSRLFMYNRKQLTDIIDSGAGTFILAEIIETNDTPFKTFDEWINAMSKRQ